MRNLLLLMTLVFGVYACSGGGEWDLGNGYKYVQFDGFNHGIVGPKSRILVFPEIESYINDENYIVGIRCESKNLIDTDPDFTTGFGYFFVDKYSSEVESGLSRDQLLSLLRRKHLHDMATNVERNCESFIFGWLRCDEHKKIAADCK